MQTGDCHLTFTVVHQTLQSIWQISTEDLNQQILTTSVGKVVCTILFYAMLHFLRQLLLQMHAPPP